MSAIGITSVKICWQMADPRADTATAPATSSSPKLSMKRYLYCGNKYWEHANGCYPVSDGPSGSLQGWSPDWSPDWPWTNDADANVANTVANTVANNLTMGEIMQHPDPRDANFNLPRGTHEKEFLKKQIYVSNFATLFEPYILNHYLWLYICKLSHPCYVH